MEGKRCDTASITATWATNFCFSAPMYGTTSNKMLERDGNAVGTVLMRRSSPDSSTGSNAVSPVSTAMEWREGKANGGNGKGSGAALTLAINQCSHH